MSEAIQLHKETKEAWELSDQINFEIYNKLDEMRDHQRFIVIQRISSYLRCVESSICVESSMLHFRRVLQEMGELPPDIAIKTKE